METKWEKKQTCKSWATFPTFNCEQNFFNEKKDQTSFNLFIFICIYTMGYNTQAQNDR